MIHSEIKQTNRRVPFETLFLRTRGRIYRLAYRVLHNAADAEDITQEAMVRAWIYRDRFHSDPSRDTERVFEAWLSRIAFNVLVDLMRRRRCRPMLSLEALQGVQSEGEAGFADIPDYSQDPSERVMERAGSERLHRAIERLAPDYRSCLLLLNEDRSYQEISALLNCPIGTVRSRVHRARASLRRALQAEGARIRGVQN